MAGVAEVRERPSTQTSTGQPSTCSAALSALELRLAIELGSTVMRVSDLLALRPGSIVRLDHAADAPVDLTVEGRPIGRGEVIVIDDMLALRVTDVLGAARTPDPEGSES